MGLKNDRAEQVNSKKKILKRQLQKSVMSSRRKPVIPIVFPPSYFHCPVESVSVVPSGNIYPKAELSLQAICGFVLLTQKNTPW